jgi:hypothetical protein
VASEGREPRETVMPLNDSSSLEVGAEELEARYAPQIR